MPLLPRHSSKALEPALNDRMDPTLPAILEFQSPSSAIINLPMPWIARGIAWIITAMVLSFFASAYFIEVDRVVTAQGVVIAKDSTIVVQPLETSIVRAINVQVGQQVHSGQILAKLDPTFAAADANDSAEQLSQLQAQVLRMQAELENRPFTYSGTDPNMAFQASVYAQRQAEFNAKMENYREKFESLRATIARSQADQVGYKDRLEYAKALEDMRKELERLNVGSKLNTLAAMDSRAEMQRSLDNAVEAAAGAQRDLAALVAERNEFAQNWHNDIADKLTDVLSKFTDARQAMTKNQLRQQLVELRSPVDGTVMSIAKVSTGSVMTAGQEFITVVPNNAPLEVEANIAGSDDGYVHLGDPVDIKFDTFPYTRYGLAHGILRIVSPDSFSSQDDAKNPSGAVPLPQSFGGSGGFWYRSRITLDKIELRGVAPDFHLVPGMPVTADIRVGKQSVLRYLMGKTLPVVSEGMREP
jgi:HlyD family secretion protein